MLVLPELRQILKRAIRLAPRFAEIEDTLVMRLQLALANSIFYTQGAVSEVDEALDEALAIADQHGDIASQLQIIWSHWGACWVYGNYPGIKPWVERVQGIIARSPELPIAPLYDRMAATSYHLLGEQKIALRHAEHAFQRLSIDRRSQQPGSFFYDETVAASARYSRILWVNGYPDKALNVIHKVVDDALGADRYSLGFFLVFGACPVSFWIGDLSAAQRYLALLLQFQTGAAPHLWQMTGSVFERARALLVQSDFVTSVERDSLVNEPSLTPFQADNLTTFSWHLLCPKSLARTTDGSSNWCSAEILRAKGESLLQSGETASKRKAEELFLRSIEISRSQSALSWELRGATSLARLWQGAGRISDARSLLTEVYERFTEGFATRDLVEAKTLIETLQRAS
jgi:hypothetical protein